LGSIARPNINYGNYYHYNNSTLIDKSGQGSIETGGKNKNPPVFIYITV